MMILEICLLLGIFLIFSVGRMAIKNYFYFLSTTLDHFKSSQSKRKVSVLIPARNEETNIQQLLEGILVQDYPNLEIVILDDNSTDKTGEILEAISKANPGRLRIIKGAPLEAGWNGKCFACHQLSKAATGDFFIFFDADVRLKKPDMISKTIGMSEETKIEFISVFPLQVMKSLGELFGISICLFFYGGFKSLEDVNDMKKPELGTAVGQCLLFTRRLYEEIGGHSLLKDSIVEDAAFGKNIKAHHIPILFCWGKGYLECRMYTSLADFDEGFSKSLASAIRIEPSCVFFLAIQLFMDVIPFSVTLLALLGYQPVASWLIWLTGLSLALNHATFCFISSVYGKPKSILPVLVFKVPGVFYATSLFIRSWILAKRGKLPWKGRVYNINDSDIKKINLKNK